MSVYAPEQAPLERSALRIALPEMTFGPIFRDHSLCHSKIQPSAGVTVYAGVYAEVRRKRG